MRSHLMFSQDSSYKWTSPKMFFILLFPTRSRGKKFMLGNLGSENGLLWLHPGINS